MNEIKILDCTLREYFSYSPIITIDNVMKLHTKLVSTGIDIIECGHLRNKPLCETILMQEDIRSFDDLLNDCKPKCLALMDINRFDVANLPLYCGGVVSGIRLCFKHSEISLVHKIAETIVNKGYDLYIQHVDYMGYTKDEIIDFISIINDLKPTSYCVVDTFGYMSMVDLKEAIKTINDNMNIEINVGFHGHNNKMMANALTFSFAESNELSNRKQIIDSTFMGLGRGAGNANTEIMLEHFRSNRLSDAIKCADYIVSFLHSEHYKRQFAYFITGIFDAHSFIADKLLMRGKSLYELYFAIKNSEKSALKRYDDINIANMLSTIGRLEKL